MLVVDYYWIFDVFYIFLSDLGYLKTIVTIRLHICFDPLSFRVSKIDSIGHYADDTFFDSDDYLKPIFRVRRVLSIILGYFFEKWSHV